MIARRITLLCALFFVDVHVRAETPKIEESDCWGKAVPCAIQAANAKRTINAPGFQLTIGAHATVEQRDLKTVQLVAGDFYAEVNGQVKFNTPYAEIRCAVECKGIFQRHADEVTVKSLAGQWVIKRLGDKQEYALRAGLQVRVAEVQDDGMAEMEFPQGLPWSPTLKEWANFYGNDFKKFKADVTVFRQEWEGAVEHNSQAQLENAKRSIASHQSELDKAKARREAEAREEDSLRKLFREKNGFVP